MEVGIVVGDGDIDTVEVLQPETSDKQVTVIVVERTQEEMMMYPPQNKIAASRRCSDSRGKFLMRSSRCCISKTMQASEGKVIHSDDKQENL